MQTMFAFLGMGGTEILVVMGAALILFGSERIPQFAKGLGQAMREFKKASNEVTNELQNAMNAEPPRHTPPARVSAPETTIPSVPVESSAPAATVPKS